MTIRRQKKCQAVKRCCWMGAINSLQRTRSSLRSRASIKLLICAKTVSTKRFFSSEDIKGTKGMLTGKGYTVIDTVFLFSFAFIHRVTRSKESSALTTVHTSNPDIINASLQWLPLWQNGCCKGWSQWRHSKPWTFDKRSISTFKTYRFTDSQVLIALSHWRSLFSVWGLQLSGFVSIWTFQLHEKEVYKNDVFATWKYAGRRCESYEPVT